MPPRADENRCWTYRITTASRNYMLRIHHPRVKLVSSEYYFSFPRKRAFDVQPISEEQALGMERRTGGFIPQAYADGIVKMAYIEAPGAARFRDGDIARILDELCSFTTQFPLLVLGKDVDIDDVRRFLDRSQSVARQKDMYFLYYIVGSAKKMCSGDIARLFARHEEIYYSSDNRVYLKALVDVSAEDLECFTASAKAGAIPFDLWYRVDESADPVSIPALDMLYDCWHDDYSDAMVETGPNLWLDTGPIEAPESVARWLAACRDVRHRVICTNPALHRLVNIYPTRRAPATTGKLVFRPGPRIVIADNAGNAAEADLRANGLAAFVKRDGQCFAPCAEDCSDLKYFCTRNASFCATFKRCVDAFFGHVMNQTAGKE